MNKIDTQKYDDFNQDFEPLRATKSIRETNFILSNNTNNITKAVKDELLYFKNDILKDMKDQLTRFNSKYIKRLAEVEGKLKETQIKSEESYQKFSIISEGISNQMVYQQRYSELEKFQYKANESIMSNELKIKNLDNLLHDSITKYDKIILDSILYPGIIGKKNEFQTFHDLIDFLLINIKKLLLAREKENLEKKEFKNRVEENLEKFQGYVNFCVNKVEEFKQEMINYDINNIIKNIEELKNNNKERLKTENSIMKKIEENEKIMENMNQKLSNNIKEKTQNMFINLRNEILDINNNMEIIQDKFNEFINDFESTKKDVEKNKIILYEIINSLFVKSKGDNQLINFLFNDNHKHNYNHNHNHSKDNIRNNFSSDFGKIIFKGESIIKQYIDRILQLSYLNKGHSIRNKESNAKNILSDLEMDLTKNKKKYLNLNIKNKKNLKFGYLNTEENNHLNKNKEFYITRTKYKRNSYKGELMDISKLFNLSKIPKIKQYNNLNILLENNGQKKNNILESKSFINQMNENDTININDDTNMIKDINAIHSKDFTKDNKHDKNENKKSKNKIFLKKEIEEEKKNEERLFQYRSKRMKISKEAHNRQMNILASKKNEFKSMTTRRKIFSAKERNTNSFNLNEKKEMFPHKTKNIFNNNNYLRNAKSNRLYSAKIIRERMKYKQMDINFDDERLVQNRENQKLTKSINQIKDILPYKERDYFQERVKKFIEFSYKRPNKKKQSKSTYNVNNYK